jgi:hypothetical protein
VTGKENLKDKRERGGGREGGRNFVNNNNNNNLIIIYWSPICGVYIFLALYFWICFHILRYNLSITREEIFI